MKRPKVRPRLYLDVDGVVNAQFGDSFWTEFRGGYAQGFFINWCADMIARLAALNVDLVWVTTWTDMAPVDIADLIGWGHHGDVLFPINGVVTYPSIEWKLEAMKAERRNFTGIMVWIDDEITKQAKDWALQNNVLAIRPDFKYGIRPHEMDAVEQYLDNRKRIR